MEPHPDPPADLEPTLVVKNVEWQRMHRLDRDPLYFGRTGLNRFDAPRQEYGVLYVAEDAHGAFIETLGRNLGTNVVSSEFLKGRAFALVTSSRPLRLVDLCSLGSLARTGADARIFAGERDVSQRWSEAWANHPSAPDGIYYPLRHDPGRRGCAIFERASDLLTARSLGALSESAYADRLGAILDHYRFALL